MAIKKAVYKVDNGSGFDDIFFKTSEDMIVNQIQLLGTNGYRKLPGGLILQSGFYTTPSGGSNDRMGGIYYKRINNLRLPVSYNNNKYKVLAMSTNATNWCFGAPGDNSSINIGCANIESEARNTGIGIQWFTIGY